MNPVINRIHEWSLEKERFGWQLDAIRRICESGAITDQDLFDLEMMGLVANGVDLPEDAHAPEPRILDARGDISPVVGTGSVTLAAIEEVRNVNRLAPKQSLRFAPNGLTVIYGDNGAGKSGYARILRCICRARCQDRAVLTDVFAKMPAAPPSAKITYRVDGEDRSTQWVAGEPVPEELAHVSVFDTDSASVHVTAENDLAFTPHGLDVLPKLAAVFLKLRDRFRARADEAEKARPVFLNEIEHFPDTEVARALAGLRHDTDVQELRTYSRRSEVEQSRQRELVELLGQDPMRQATVLAARKGQIVQLQDICARSLARTSDAAVEGLREIWRNAQAARQAAHVAAGELFTGETISGVGSDAWRVLWESARRFSESTAYPDTPFPVTDDRARCVLCLQHLQEDASVRMRRFEDYVKGATQQAAITAEEALRDALRPLMSMASGPRDTEGNREALSIESEDLAARVRRTLTLNRWRKRAILRNCNLEFWGEIPAGGENLCDELQAVVDAIEIRRQEAIRAYNLEERQRLERELLELRAREWLESVVDDDVQKEVDRLVLHRRLNHCIRDVATDAVTRKNTELTDEFVTEALKAAFTSEMKTIGLDYLKAELIKVGGQYGISRYQVQFAGAEREAKLPDVLSEGEFRAIALASFLAELATSPTRSGLIFDDPVSSLDHHWRQRLAKRLAQEATLRQVVVFTHDIVFLHALMEEAAAVDCPALMSHLLRTRTAVGLCLDGVPWVAMKTSKRLGFLKARLQDAAATFTRGDREAYERQACSIYGRLRETWERAIEEVLFRAIVQRFAREIQTMRLRYATDITDDDVKIVDANMSKCSTFMEGHDQPAAVNEPVPDPEELAEDIAALDDWVTSIHKRRN